MLKMLLVVKENENKVVEGIQNELKKIEGNENFEFDLAKMVKLSNEKGNFELYGYGDDLNIKVSEDKVAELENIGSIVDLESFAMFMISDDDISIAEDLKLGNLDFGKKFAVSLNIILK